MTDLFALGREAGEAVRTGGSRGIFARCRQLLPTGAWKGPRDAAEAYVEEEDLSAAGDLTGALAVGVRTVVATTADAARAAALAGLRVRLRILYRTGEPAAERQARLTAAAALAADPAVADKLDGVIPTPLGEPGGLDTLTFMATCRRELAGFPSLHVVADFVRLGHRLAQMSLGFGADELFGPIMPERALRLGANANNPVMTRKEAAMLIRGAGLLAFERTSSGALEEVQG
jgi:hypothetical protein